MKTEYIKATTNSLEAFYNKSKNKLSKTQKTELENIIQQYRNCPPRITPAEIIQLASLAVQYMIATSGHHS